MTRRSTPRRRSATMIRRVAVFSNSAADDALFAWRIAGPLTHAGVEVIPGGTANDLHLEAVDHADAILVQRDFPGQWTAYRQVIERARAAKRPVLYELDDLLLELPPDHPDRQTHYYAPALLPAMSALLEADLVITSTELLRLRLQPVNPDVVVFPNRLDDSLWSALPARSASQGRPIVIGYFGTATHGQDVELVGAALQVVLDRQGDRVALRFYGCPPPRSLRADARVVWTPLTAVNYPEYVALMREAVVDIGIAPLADTDFNRVKSEAKFLEYSAAGIPGIYGDVVPYSAVVDPGRTGWLAASGEEWVRHLEQMIEDVSLRERMREAAYREVHSVWSLAACREDWRTVVERGLRAARLGGVEKAERVGLASNLTDQINAWAGHLEAEAAAQRAEAERQAREVTVRGKQLSSLQDQFRGLGDEHAKSVRGLKEALEQQRSRLTALAQNLDSQRAVVEEKAHEAADLRTQLDHKDRELKEALARELSQRWAVASRDQELADVRASTSWRLTAPLRVAKDMMRWGMGRGGTAGLQALVGGERFSLRAIPTRHLEMREGVYSTAGDDPQLVLESSRGRSPSGWVMVTGWLRFSERSTGDLPPRLFVDTGNGFAEETSFALDTDPRGSLHQLLRLPSAVVRLRLDPCEGRAQFRLERLQIRELGRIEVGIRLLWGNLRPALGSPRQLWHKARLATRLAREVGPQAIGHRLTAGRSAPGAGAASAIPAATPFASETPPAAELSWRDYPAMRKQIAGLAGVRKEQARVQAPDLFELDEAHLASHAAGLVFRHADTATVSIVIPAHNQARLTLECLTSVARHTDAPTYEIILVDDGSTDATSALAQTIGAVRVVRHAERQGFIASCNDGLAQARGEYTLLLNNDVQVTPGWLAALAEVLAGDPTIGAVGPKVIFPDGRLQEAGALIRRDCQTQLVGVFEDPADPRYNYARDVDYCSGVCLLVRTETLRALGGLDANYAPAYCEDVDLCLKLQQQGQRVRYCPQSLVVHHLSATSGRLDQMDKLTLVTRNQQKLSERWQAQIDRLNQVRLIAFYLPQFHPIAENDRWWGPGFTEWRNVMQAQANFEGHYQPHVPADLGFYDLRLEETMARQAQLAQRYGVHGFCYYYYWFGGQRLLEMPLERMLRTGTPAIPFCLCWANENWTRAWDGREDQVLMAQRHSDADDRAVMRDLVRYLRHPNYIRVNGRPLLLVYRVSLFPDMPRTVRLWREVCEAASVPFPYLALVESFDFARQSPSPSAFGFDASVEFPPHELASPMDPPGRILNPRFRGVVSDYREAALRHLARPVPGHTRFPTAMPGWDNTPRRQDDPYIFARASPGAYQAWLEAAIATTRMQNFGDERLVFINAWNEWAEGTHLEPDLRFGHEFLEATRNALEADVLVRPEPDREAHA